MRGGKGNAIMNNLLSTSQSMKSSSNKKVYVRFENMLQDIDGKHFLTIVIYVIVI